MEHDAEVLARTVRWLFTRTDLREALIPPGLAVLTAYDPLVTKGDADILDAALADQWELDALEPLARSLYQLRGLTPPPAEYFVITVDEARLRAAKTTMDLDWGRSEFLRRLRDVLQIPLTRIIRHGKENALWSLVCDGEVEIHLGPTATLVNPDKVRTLIFDRTNVLLPRWPRNRLHEWDLIVEMIGHAATVVVSEEFTRLGTIRSIIQGYCEANQLHPDQYATGAELDNDILSRRPFLSERGLHIHAQHCHSTYCREYHPEVSAATLIDMLRGIGGERVTATTNGAHHTSRSYWLLRQVPELAAHQGYALLPEEPEAMPARAEEDEDPLRWLEREGMLPPRQAGTMDDANLTDGEVPF